MVDHQMFLNELIESMVEVGLFYLVMPCLHLVVIITVATFQFIKLKLSMCGHNRAW